jgi:predicted O-methyltransferase YrrM
MARMTDKLFKDLQSDPDDRAFHAIAARVQPYTMTMREGPEAAYALFQAVRYVVRNRIAGAIVECGVWRGGSMMLAALALKHFGDTGRELYLYDTYEGMTRPEDVDVDFDGNPMKQAWSEAQREDKAIGYGGAVDTVRSYVKPTGYPMEKMHFVAGDVLETIPKTRPETIAILRLDTDWYKSTLHELTHLYDVLSPGGVLIIDDYGWCRGARQATDEFFAGRDFQPLMQRLNQGARLIIKP